MNVDVKHYCGAELSALSQRIVTVEELPVGAHSRALAVRAPKGGSSPWDKIDCELRDLGYSQVAVVTRVSFRDFPNADRFSVRGVYGAR